MDHVYANRPRGRTRPRARGRPAPAGAAAPASPFATSARWRSGPCWTRSTPDPGGAPLVADLAAGPAPYLLEAIAQRPRARALVCDVDPDALARAQAAARRARRRRPRAAARRRTRSTATRSPRCDPRPDVVLELGLYGMYHDDALIERHFRDLAELVAPRPDRVQRADVEPGDRVHRPRVAQPPRRALRLAAAAGRADPRLRRARPATSRARSRPTASASTASCAWPGRPRR